MNAVFGYSLALLLATGGPGATSAIAQREMKLVKMAAAAPVPPPATAAPTAKSTAAKPVVPPPRTATPAMQPTRTLSPAAGLPAISPDSSVTERPAWVGEPDGLRERGIYQMHVYVGPELSRTECEQKLTAEIERRLVEYVSQAMPYDVPVAVPFDIARLRPRIVTQEWEERVQGTTADLVFLHVQLRIDEKLRQEWKAKALEALREDRSRLVMLGYAGVVAAAAAAFGFLKWSGRSSGGAALLPAAGVLAIIVGATVMMKWFFSV
jgi:hypothetical protein